MEKEQDLMGPMICNHCGNNTVFRKQGRYRYKAEEEDIPEWWTLYEWHLLKCLSCSKPTLLQQSISTDHVPYDIPIKDIEYYFWEELYPTSSKTPKPSADMPKDIVEVYEEAKVVFPHSPRASTALLRLALQKLCIHLGQPGNNLNEDIKALVKAGLSPIAQQALDVVRVIGNNAVHPGHIDFNDKSETALKLFELINFIVEELITRPKEIAKIYSSLPESQKEQIKKRDKIS